MLKFNEQGKFKVVQITDLHMGHFGDTTDHDQQTQKLISDILDYEKPDLVAVSGDVISGNKWDKKT